jgi:hypothetical protein
VDNRGGVGPAGPDTATAPVTGSGGAQQLPRYRSDILCAAGAGTIAAACAVTGFAQLDFEHLSSVYNTWFDADIQRIVGGYDNRGLGWHVRTNVHPLYALLVAAPCIVLRKFGLTMVTWLAASGWCVLLILGASAALRGGAPMPLVLFLGGGLAGQVVLHMLYGDQLFLYALHFAPFMVLIAALACASRWRKAALAHNITQFRAATHLQKMTTTDEEFIHIYIR